MEVEHSSPPCEHLSDKHYTKSVQGKSVYKDQCARCFYDPKHPGGILLCLTCFNSFCQDDHLKEHQSKRSSHCLYLRIQMFEKPAPPQGHQITKVAIGKEGGAIGGPEYDTKYTLYCLTCNRSYPNVSALGSKQLEGLVQSLIDCDSAYKKQALVQWELEMHPCEHTLTLEQNPQNKDLSKCGECELSSNLWLCLTCGHIGCARKNFDGSGGNGHGMEHYDKTKHPLVVKSGTITAEGSASVHCYKCDDEVTDNELPSHLAVLGINISEQRKTEKTVQELTLDMNLNLSLSRLVEEGKKMTEMYGPGYTGMDNIGNSCYLNSIVQVLMSLKEYRDQYYIKGQEHSKACNNLPSECLYCQVAKVAFGLYSGKYSQKLEKTIVINEVPTKQEYQEAIRPFDFKMLVAGNNQEFKSSRQQDALEYLQHLFDKLAKQEQEKKLRVTSELFDFKLVNKLICTGCNGYKLVEQKTNEWKFPVPVPTKQQLEEYAKKLEGESEAMRKCKSNEEPQYDTTFEKCLEMLREGDVVQTHCPKCQKLTVFRSLFLFASSPQYLLAVSNRFVLEKWVPKKLNALIKIGEKLDISPFLAETNKEGGQRLKEGGEAEDKPEFSEDNVANIVELGFTRNAAIRALSKNNNNVEAACGWIYEHLDDADLNDPVKPKGKQSKHSGPPQDLIEQVMGLGFTSEQATVTLIKYVRDMLTQSNNVDAAIGYLFDNGGDVSSLMSLLKPEKMQVEAGPVNPLYELHAVIVHLGKSVHSGHYVCYIKLHGSWVLFNDSHVFQTEEPVLQKGYIYLFKQC